MGIISARNLGLHSAQFGFLIDPKNNSFEVWELDKAGLAVRLHLDSRDLKHTIFFMYNKILDGICTNVYYTLVSIATII